MMRAIGSSKAFNRPFSLANRIVVAFAVAFAMAFAAFLCAATASAPAFASSSYPLQVGTSDDWGKTIKQFSASGIDMGTVDLSKLDTGIYANNKVELEVYIKNVATGIAPKFEEAVIAESTDAFSDGAFSVDWSTRTYRDGIRYITLTFNLSDFVAGTYTANLVIESLSPGVTVNDIWQADAQGNVSIPVKVKLTGVNPRLAPRITGLAAEPGNAQVRLDWDENDDIHSARVYRRDGKETATDPDKIDLTKYQEVGSQGLNSDYATHFVDNTVQNGKEYSYVVVSGSYLIIGEAGKGYPSKAATTTPSGSYTYKPDAPNLSNPSPIAGHVRLGWDAGDTELEEGKVDHFNVYCDGKLGAQVSVSAVHESVSDYGRSHSWSYDFPLDDAWNPHSFRVSAVGLDGTEGYLSDAVISQAASDAPVILSHRAWYGQAMNNENDPENKVRVFIGIDALTADDSVDTLDFWRAEGTAAPDTSGKPYMTVKKAYGYMRDPYDLEDVNVEPNKTYTYTVRANNDDGSVSDFYTLTMKTVSTKNSYYSGGIHFNTPTVTYTVENDATPMLSVNASSWESEGYKATYRFYRNDKQLASFSGNDSHMFFDTPTADGYYTYRVDMELAGVTIRGRDYTFHRDTTPTDEAALPKAPDAPKLTGRISAVPDGWYSAITLSWTPSKTGGEVEGYHVYRKDAGEFVEGKYRVHAWNGTTYNDYWGNYRYLTIKDADACSLVEPAGNDSEGYLGDPDLGILQMVGWGDGSQGYQAGAPHEYYITAYNQYGESAPSNTVTFPYSDGRPPANADAKAPAAPTITGAWVEWIDRSNDNANVEAGSFDEQMGYQIHVAWDEPANAAATVSSYKVVFDDMTSGDGGDWGEPVDENGDGIDDRAQFGDLNEKTVTVARYEALKDPGILAGTSANAPVFQVDRATKWAFGKQFKVTVYAVNAAGEKASKTVTVSVDEAPRIQVKSGNGRAIVRWSGLLYDDKATLTGWELYKRSEFGLPELVGTFGASTHQYEDSYVQLGWTYEYYVVAKTSAGDRRSATAARQITESATGVIAAPTNLKATVVNGAVMLSWTRPANEEDITYYYAEMKVEESDEWVHHGGDFAPQGSDGMRLDYDWVSDCIDKTVSVRVYGVNYTREGDRSNVATFKLTSKQANARVEGVPAVVPVSGEAGDGVCRVTWTSSADAPAATHYELHRDGGDYGLVFSIASKGAGARDYEYVDRDVENGVTYTYKLIPYNYNYPISDANNAPQVQLTPTGKTPDELAMEEVAEYIRALPAPAEVTLDDAEQINAVAGLWDGLSREQQKTLGRLDYPLVQKLDDDLAALDRLVLMTQYSDAVAPVQAQIDALPAPSAVSSSDKAEIEAARAAYDALAPDEVQGLVDASKLVDDEDALASLPARKLMGALPAAASVTEKDRAQVEAARAAYDALTPGARAQVPEAIAQKLFDAEAKLWELAGGDALTVYTVIFNSNEGSYVNAQKVESGKTAIKPADPTRNGFTFVAWQLDGRNYDFSTPVMGDITLVAKWARGDEPGPQPGGDTQPMYRLYNPNSGEHFYTASEKERDDVDAAGWNYEGVGWIAPKTSDTPVYRLYSGTDHHYTKDKDERDWLVNDIGWKDEGIGWYSDDAEGVPLYRQYNPFVDPAAPTNNSGSHNYTTDKAENDWLISLGWKYEGISWYGVAESLSAQDAQPLAVQGTQPPAAQGTQPLAAALLVD